VWGVSVGFSTSTMSCQPRVEARDRLRLASPFFSFLTWTRSASGFPRYLAAFAAGVLASFAFPPFDAFPVLWVSFPVLYLLLLAAGTGRQAFGLGWSFAFGLLMVSLHWISGSLFVDIKSFWWALPFALAGLPALFSLYYALAVWGAWRWGVRRAEGPLVLALLWFGAELARGHLFTGFPWDMLGYVWGDWLWPLQVVSVIGLEGLTLLTLVLVLLPSLFALTDTRKALIANGLGLMVLVALVAAGGWRLQGRVPAFVEGVTLRLVQPEQAQAMKWRQDQKQTNFEELMALSFDAPSAVPITHYIWPETATAYHLAEDPLLRSALAARMAKDTVLLTGVLRRQPQEDGTLAFYNSLIGMDARGNVIAGYDKHHLVPFGEYMPLRSLITVDAIAMKGSDFTAGDGPRTLRVPRLPPFGALICYEVLFSGDVLDPADPPALFVNVTNDAWYDHTMGPEQHFAIARARAIEEGIPLVRAANKGMTGVVDPYGVAVLAPFDGKAAFLDAALPQALPARTFWVRHREGAQVLASILLLCIGFIRFFYSRPLRS